MTYFVLLFLTKVSAVLQLPIISLQSSVTVETVSSLFITEQTVDHGYEK